MGIFLRRIWILIVLIPFAFIFIEPAIEAQENEFDDCDNIRVLMNEERSPYDYELGGGNLETSGEIERDSGSDHYADFWTFEILRPTSNNVPQNVTLTLSFDDVEDDLLEFAFFRGLLALTPYQSIEEGEDYQQSFTADGLYTIVVRRINIADERSFSYRLEAEANPSQGLRPAQLNSIRDVNNNNEFSPRPEFEDGLVHIDLPSADVRIHLDGTRLVHPRNGQSAQVYFPTENFSNANGFSLHIGEWARQIDILAGDLAVRGDNRLYFLERFDYRGNLDGSSTSQLNLENVNFPDGTNIRIDWASIKAVWLLEGCTGFKLQDGRSFVGVSAPTERNLIATGTTDSFSFRLNSLVNGVATRHDMTFDWHNIPADAEITLSEGVYSFPLLQNRYLELQSSNLSLVTQADSGYIEASLIDRNATIRLDWVNMDSFSFKNDILRFRFTDEPRGETSRNGAGLASFESFNGTIRIIYQANADGLEGEERLLLPRSESYLEIVTPAGLPAYDGRALPDEMAFGARALNNLGADCNPASQILEESQCSSNGNPNPANGNLWYSVTDLEAFGSIFNLNLQRSYNSRAAVWDGPFGYGWDSLYRLDYNVQFNPETSSRPIIPGEYDYPVALDVAWVPRGLLTYISPTGSRHQFVLRDTSPEGRELWQALTMPNWVLSRDGQWGEHWTMYQDNGLILEFDRAGRLISLAHQQENRRLTISYPRETIDGPASLGSDYAVIINDAPEGQNPERQLELYYDSSAHIERSILRDLSHGDEDCLPDKLCFETRYHYEDGNLVEVEHGNGQAARYQYDERHLLLAHDDPFAPIAPRMVYSYDENSRAFLSAQIQAEDGSLLLWRGLSLPSINGNQLSIELHDEWNNSQRYVYDYSAGSLGQVGTSFTLLERYNALAAVDRFEAVPQSYEWENGLLVQRNTRIFRDGQGRNGIDYHYTAAGHISCIACSLQGMPELRVNYTDPAGPLGIYEAANLISYADGSSETIGYDSLLHPTNFIDRHGATYELEWNETGQLIRVSRSNDSATWLYSYNLYGQMSSMSYSIAGESPYELAYQYDALGRLIRIQDNLLGTYEISYAWSGEGQSFASTISIIDPIGVASFLIFDAQGRLTNRFSGNYDHAFSYAYDAYGRLISETRITEDSVPNSRNYSYSPSPSIQSNGTELIINGYTLNITDFGGTSEAYTYDALGRLRRYSDAFGNYSDYSYSIEDVTNNFGLQILEQSFLVGNASPIQSSYQFDARQQLRQVSRGANVWTIDSDGSARQGRLQATNSARTIGIQQVLWGVYQSGFPTSVSVDLTNLSPNLISGQSLENDYDPAMELSFDFLGHVIENRDGAENSFARAYCPAALGGVRVVYGLPNSNVDCSSSAFAASYSYDYHGRLQRIEDSNGLREISYQAGTEIWELQIVFTGTDGESYHWEMSYNSNGDLLRWRDENGFLRNYEYDNNGRLVAVTVEDIPEASYTFRYNNADMLVEMRDGTGRGILYNYNRNNQVTSQVTQLNAATLSYNYDSMGRIVSVISPLGYTTSYGYEDASDPSRLTSIVEPSGNQHHFSWDENSNNLFYTDPASQTTVYSFDALGLLWRVRDSMIVPENAGNRVFENEEFGRRESEIHYDSAGFPRNWIWDVRTGNPANPARSFNLSQSDFLNWTFAFAGSDWSQSLSFNPNGQISVVNGLEFSYDPLNRLASVSDGDEQEWLFERNDGEGLLEVIDPLAGSFVFRYDALFRLVERTADDASIQYHYNPVDSNPDKNYGNLIMEISLPSDLGQRRYYFSPGNTRSGTPPMIVLLALNNRISYIYDEEGLLRSIRREICSDSEAFIENCNNAWFNQVQISYDNELRPIRIEDENGNFESFAYDNLDNLISYQDITGRSFSYRYDSVNRLISLTSSTGVKLLFAYNRSNQIIGLCRSRFDAPDDYATCQTNGGEIEAYAYESSGLLSSRTFGETSLSYDYNQLGQMRGSGRNASDIRYDYDSFGRLSEMSIDGDALEFRYDIFNRLLGAGDLSFEYNVLGQLNRYEDAHRSMDYQYQADGYSLDDGSQSFFYGLNENALANRISVNDNEILTLAYPSGNSLSGFDANHADGSRTTTNQLDAQFNILSLGDYTPEDGYQLFHSFDNGNLLRQSDLVIDDANLQLSIVYGYDNDRRPVTMRLTDSTAARVIYTESLNYDNLGRLIGLSRLYDDGSQLSKHFEYANASQLSRSLVSISHPLDISLQFTGLLLLGFSIRIRRRYWIWLGLGILGLSILSFIPIQAQNSESYAFLYAYDDRGNLAQVRSEGDGETCLFFEYDGANRLVSMETPDNEYRYSYDAFGRLSEVDGLQLSYEGGSQQLFALDANGETVYYGQVKNQVPFFQISENGALQWLLSDGRSGTLEVAESESTTIWLVNPFGDLLSLQSPEPSISPCHLRNTLELDASLRLQSRMDGSLWDSAAGLYFIDGRAFDAETGMYLQANPDGADALGNLYLFANAANLPMLETPEGAFGLEGLRVLDEALNTIAVNESLSAEAVKARFLPQLAENFSPVPAMLSEGRAPFQTTLSNLMLLPNWLENHYNLPAPYIAANGSLIIPLSPSGQGGNQHDFAMDLGLEVPKWLDELNPSLDFNVFRNQQETLADSIFTGSNQPSLPQAYLNSSQLFDNPQPWGMGQYRPDDVFAYLPQDFQNPAAALAGLEFLDKVSQSDTQAIDWLNLAIEETVPDALSEELRTFSQWRGVYFDDESNRPALVSPVPNLPNSFQFIIGFNEDWLRMGE